MNSKELEQSIRIQKSKINKLEKRINFLEKSLKKNEEDKVKLIENLPIIIKNTINNERL